MKIIFNLTLIKMLFFVLTLLVFTVYFFDAITSFFSQDDFFHLRAILLDQIQDIPKFFTTFRNEYAFYRPLSRETYNLLMYSVFGLNSSAFHLVNLFLIIVNGYLIFKLARKLKVNLFTIFLSLLIYFFSAVHSIELYYLSSVQNLLATTFSLLCLNEYANFQFFKKRTSLMNSSIFFVLALFSHESAIILPFVIVIFVLLFSKNFLSDIKNTLTFGLILLLRSVIFFFSIGLDKQQVYTTNFSIVSILNTFFWFVLWSFGLPEMLTDFMTLRLQFNPNLFKYYSGYTVIVFPALIAIFLLLLVFIIVLRKKIFADKTWLFFSSAFGISLIPYLFFPQHKFIYYLSMPIIYFSFIIGIILGKICKSNKGVFMVSVVLLLYFIISFMTVSLNKITYWAAKRSKSAQVIVEDVKKRYPFVSKGTIFFIEDDPNYPFIANEWGTSSKQAFYILSGSDAFQLIYNDPAIKVYYQALENNTDYLKDKKAIIYQARFPY